MLNKLKSLAARLRTRAPLRDWPTVAVLLVAATLLAATPLGARLNGLLFLDPLARARLLLGRAPALDARLRVIILDDKSLAALGRHPTFGEWMTIAAQLTALGYDKVFLQGLHDLPRELGELPRRHELGTYVLGTAVAPDDDSARTAPYDKVAARLMIDALGVEADLPLAKTGYLPASDALGHADRLGSLNIKEDNTVPAGFRLLNGKVLPHIGLLARDGLSWTVGGLSNDGGRVPLSEDGTLYVDLVDVDATVKQTTIVKAFYAPGGDRLLSAPGEAVKKRLAGGKIAVLVADGYSGSRFIESAQGNVPTYFVLLSSLSNTLQSRYVHRPAPLGTLCFALLPLFLLPLLAVRRGRGVYLAAAALGVGIAAASVAAFCAAGWVLPCAPWLACLAAGLGVHAARDVSALVKDKLLLARDLELGTLVQKRLLPASTQLTFGDWRVEVLYKPYSHMAGDWYQHFASAPAATEPFAMVTIGDVVGKGSSAALTTALISGVWSRWARRWAAGDAASFEFVTDLHETILDTFKGTQNTSICAAVLRGGALELLALGAPQWMRLSAVDRSGERIRAKRGNPLGLNLTAERLQAARFVQKFDARPGDLFVAFTDGVLDSRIAEAQFLRAVGETTCPPAALAGEAMKLLVEASRHCELPDDATVLVIEYTGRAAAGELSA